MHMWVTMRTGSGDISTADKYRLTSFSRRPPTMSHVCEVCAREFTRMDNLRRHQREQHGEQPRRRTKDRVVEPVSSGDSDVVDDESFEHDTEMVSLSESEEEQSEEGDEQDLEETDSELDESVTSSEEDEDFEETDSELDESVTSSEEEETDSEWDESVTSSEGEEEETELELEDDWTLYRDWTVVNPCNGSEVPQQVLKETKRFGRKFYFVEFAWLPYGGTVIQYSTKWISEQKLLREHGYVALK